VVVCPFERRAPGKKQTAIACAPRAQKERESARARDYYFIALSFNGNLRGCPSSVGLFGNYTLSHSLQSERKQALRDFPKGPISFRSPLN
jgi:hypothetical protein